MNGEDILTIQGYDLTRGLIGLLIMFIVAVILFVVISKRGRRHPKDTTEDLPDYMDNHASADFEARDMARRR